jgi:uroporphyrinogen decarboxylase
MNHAEMAQALVRQMHANNGLAPVDLEQFWADQEVAQRNPWGTDIPQVPMGLWMGADCVFDEVGVPEDMWRFQNDEEWRLQISKAYNDKAEKIVGRRLLWEIRSDPNALRYPPVKQLHDIFEAWNKWHGGSWWLQASAHTEDELAALLDRVEERLANLRQFLLPPQWDEVRGKLMEQGVKPGLYRAQRGPVTFATSVFGTENLLMLIMTNPDLAARFRDAILNAMLGLARVLDEEAGYLPETAPRGFYFLDDNCCLLSPEMYEFFGYPILKGVFDRYSPNPEDGRGQHSDSAMGHLLPILARLEMTSVNLGPTLTVSEIREHLPRAVIHGQLAPFTFSRNEEQKIVEEFLRDFDMAREKRGLVFTTAGSINNGSRLTGLRLIMAAIQRHGHYD